MMISEDIFSQSHKHYLSDDERGRQLLITNNKIVLSAIGGFRGVSGDFKETFEVAIMNKRNGKFVTQFYCENSEYDVIPFMSKKDLLELMNRLFYNGFQVDQINQLGGGG